MNKLTHMSARKAASLGVDVLVNKVDNNREDGMLKLLDISEKYMSGEDYIDFTYARELVSNKNSATNKYLNKALDEIDPFVAKTTILNLGFEAMVHGTKTMHKMKEVHKCNIPWLILMDPTSACNLKCTGCWAAEYGNRLNLTYDEMNRVVREGKELGIHFYMFTGGEPLVRKEDIIKLCRENRDCEFLAFTNATLVDEEFCKEMKEVGNLALAISLEGSAEVNDLRRGDGVYDKVMKAMDLLKEYGLIFGSSICYTS